MFLFALYSNKKDLPIEELVDFCASYGNRVSEQVYVTHLFLMFLDMDFKMC